MRQSAGVFICAWVCLGLWSCGGTPAPAQDTAPALAAAEDSASAEATASDIADTTCGSLEPLLAWLPAAQTMGGLPEAYRHCDPGAFGVAVGYRQKGERFSGYEFIVKVLDGGSPYVASLLNPEGATADTRALLQQTVMTSGELFRTMLTICEGYVRNPIIPDGRNPLITAINGLDVCIRDDLDPNRQIWNALAVSGGLGLHLTLRGDKAGGIQTTEAARANLAPLFAQFKTGVSR
jgi:hypothetical protein